MCFVRIERLKADEPETLPEAPLPLPRPVPQAPSWTLSGDGVVRPLSPARHCKGRRFDPLRLRRRGPLGVD